MAAERSRSRSPKRAPPTDRIDEICEMWENGDMGSVQAADEVELLLKEKDLLRVEVIHPRRVGFHNKNRDMYGGSAGDALELISKIVKAGFSLHAMQHATVEEEQPGQSIFEEHNMKLANNNPSMAPVKAGSVDMGSVACGHTYQGFRQFQAAAPHDDPQVCRDGKLDLDKLAERDKKYAEHARTGVPCKVLSHRVSPRYPKVVPLLCEARNMDKRMEKGENEVQIMCRMFLKAQTMSPPDWERVRRAVIRSLPNLMGELDDYIFFLVKKSGGRDGKYLWGFVKWHRYYVRSALREVPGEIYVAAAKLPEAYLGYGCVKAAFCGPIGKVVMRRCAFVSASEINQANTKEKAALRAEAEEILRKSRQLMPSVPVLKEAGEDDNAVIDLFGFLDITMSRLVLGNKETKKRFEKPLEVAWEFCARIKQRFGSEVDCKAYEIAWPRPSDGSSTSTQDAKIDATTVNLEEYNAHGQREDDIASLRDLGFNIGGHVALKTSPNIMDSLFCVRAPEKGEVCLEQLSTGVVTLRVPMLKLGSDYEPRDVSKVREYHGGWPSKRPCVSKEYMESVMRSRIMAALHGLGLHQRETALHLEDAVQILMKPTRSVIAKHTCAPGTVVLVPETFRISKRESSVSREDLDGVTGDIVVGVKKQHNLTPGHEYILGSPFADSKFVSPCWAVRHTSDEKKVNMMWQRASASDVCVFEWVRPPTASGWVPVVKPCTAQRAAAPPLPSALESPPGAAPPPTTKKPTAAPPDTSTATEYAFSIPIMVNFKEIPEGEELRYFIAAKPQAAKPMQPLSAAVLLAKGRGNKKA